MLQNFKNAKSKTNCKNEPFCLNPTGFFLHLHTAQTLCSIAVIYSHERCRISDICSNFSKQKWFVVSILTAGLNIVAFALHSYTTTFTFANSMQNSVGIMSPSTTNESASGGLHPCDQRLCFLTPLGP
jgi:hypothetical protein